MENSLFSGVPKFRQSTASLQHALILGHLKTINFPFETNGKLMILGVPILKHVREITVNHFIQKINTMNRKPTITKKNYRYNSKHRFYMIMTCQCIGEALNKCSRDFPRVKLGLVIGPRSFPNRDRNSHIL